MKTYLTHHELQTLAGIRTLKGVLLALDRERWPYFIGNDGWPRVLRSYHDKTPERRVARKERGGFQ